MQCVAEVAQLQLSARAEQHQTDYEHLTAGGEHILHRVAQRAPEVEIEEALADRGYNGADYERHEHRARRHLLQRLPYVYVLLLALHNLFLLPLKAFSFFRAYDNPMGMDIAPA